MKKNYFLILIYIVLLSYVHPAHDGEEIDDINDILFNIKTEDNYFDKLDFKNVVTYDDKNYITRIKNDKPLLMFIYTPYDSNCQSAVQIFVSMADFIKNNKTDLTMAKVNIYDNKEFAKDYKIDDVPKLLFIGRDRNVLEYKQEITYYNLLRFVQK